MALTYVTAGETHGPQLTAIITGLPAGLPLLEEDINRHLERRQQGYGRGDRMKIERDRVQVRSGVRFGRTLASPVALVVENRDWANWTEAMSIAPIDEEQIRIPEHLPDSARERAITRPRPGHADLNGILKWHHHDARNVLERASARKTAVHVAVGAVAQRLLAEFGIEVFAHVIRLGPVAIDTSEKGWKEIREAAEASPFRMADSAREDELTALIDRAKEEGDTVGGIFEVVATGVPVGLGGCMERPDRLDGQLAQAVMSIPAIKAVEIGEGFANAARPGSQVHDAIYYDRDHPENYLDGHGPTGGFYRKTNRAGGMEGGISNGEPIIVRGAMKPISTLRKPLPSVDFESKEAFEAQHERSDVCAVPAAAVVGEAAVAFVLARAFLEKFPGDHVDDMRAAYDAYVKYLENR
jgi:chorismate synthase